MTQPRRIKRHTPRIPPHARLPIVAVGNLLAAIWMHDAGSGWWWVPAMSGGLGVTVMVMEWWAEMGREDVVTSVEEWEQTRNRLRGDKNG